MLTNRDILCLSSIDWDFIWQGHQEIMATLAAQGNRVLFVENTGVRAPTLQDWPRLRKRIWTWLRTTKGFRQERDNLFVYSPILLPFPYSRVARWVNRVLLLRALRRWMRTTEFRPAISWTFLPTPLVLDVMRELDSELTIFYWIDKLSESSRAARRLEPFEWQMVAEADLVFVTSQKLFDEALCFNSQVHLFPFGVNWTVFERARQMPHEPEDLRHIRRPIVGYIGGIRKEINQALLYEAAERIPEASFVMVGPMQVPLARRTPPNLLFLGPRKHDQLPHYIGHFDVGIIPYVVNEYTAHIYPAKLSEYLAMGIPVVSTALPEVLRMNAEHDNLIAVAGDAERFVQAIQDVLANGSASARRDRIEVARQNAWEARITQMSELIEHALSARQAKPAGRWQESLLRLYRLARRRVFKTVLTAGIIYLACVHSPLMWWIAEPLRVVESPRPTDAIVVFAGGVGESGKAGGGYQERLKQALELYRRGLAPRLIFSSGYTFVFHEVEIMRELAVAQGIPASAILLEQRATNTYENVRLVTDMLEQQGWRSVLLVSSPYHMRRALLTWRTAAPQIRVIPAAVPESQFYAHTAGVSLEQVRGVIHEYVGILYYWWRGWI